MAWMRMGLSWLGEPYDNAAPVELNPRPFTPPESVDIHFS